MTYAVLMKAFVDMVLLISRTAAFNTVYMIAIVAGFINIVACVLCLAGIAKLSKQYVYAFRIMVAVIAIMCVTVFLIILDVRLITNSYMTGAYSARMVTLVSAMCIRMLIGVAFLCYMRGNGEILRKAGDDHCASSSEKVGSIYLYLNSMGALFSTFALYSNSKISIAAAVVFDIIGIILELLMYRRAADAAFLIWKNRTVSISDEMV